jgi:predicted nucleic acid-binding Zn ribbon protein
MSHPDSPTPDHVIDLRSEGGHGGRPGKECPSCGEAVPPRRQFCTEQCRTALNRIRRTEADIDRLKQLIASTTDDGRKASYQVDLDALLRRAEERRARLSRHRKSDADER